MTIYFVTSGAWGSGTGSPLAPAQVDGNFYDVDQRIVGLTSDLAVGKRIDFVTYTDSSMTFHYTDGTTQTIPLPVATFKYVGPWMNSTPYIVGDLFTANNGFYQVLEDHTTPASPAPFDPTATDGTTANNPLYQLWMPLYDTLNSLTDVEINTGLAVGDTIIWNGGAWVNQTPSLSGFALDGLTDVVITAPINQQVLVFNGADWVNATVPGTTLDGLSDATITSPIAGQPLIFDGAFWVNKNVADLPALNVGSVSGAFALNLSTNEMLRYQMTGNCIISGFTWPSSSSGRFVRRIIEIMNTGAFTWTWPSAVKWPQGIDPTQSSGTDIYAIHSYDGGATVFGSVVGQNYS